MQENERVTFRELSKAKVVDSEGKQVGRVQDLGMSMDLREPVITHLGVQLLWTDRIGETELVRRVEDLVVLVPWSSVKRPGIETIVISGVHPNLAVETAAGRRLVGRDVLNKQMLDPSGTRIQRVDDVLLAFRGGALEVLGLEVSRSFILTSSKLRNLILALRQKHSTAHASDVIPWESVERIGPEAIIIEEPSA